MSEAYVPTPTPETAPFWDATWRNELVLPVCVDTGRRFFPPRARSPFTGGEVTWAQASGRGTLASYIVVHRAAPGFESQAPYVVAAVQLDEGVRLLSNLHGSSADDLVIGALVEVYFESRGNVSIPQFKMAASSSDEQPALMTP